MTPQNQAIGPDVQRDQRATENHLCSVGETRRVDDGTQIVIDEAACIPRFPSPLAETILEWGEWTKPLAQLDPRTPEDTRNVHPSQSGSAKYERHADRYKDDEREVENEDQVGQDQMYHGERTGTRDAP